MFGLYPKLAIGLTAFALPLAALGSAVFDSIKGDVRVAVGAQKPAAVKPAQRVNPGSTVITGPDGMVVLRFDDEQRVVLAPNSEFRIVDFAYPRGEPRRDRAEFELLKGAVRVTTGGVVARNAPIFALRTPHTTIGARGTDFMVAIVSQTWLSVIEGAIAAATKAGAGVLGAGTYGVVASTEQLARAVTAAGVPSAVHERFNELRSVPVVAKVPAEAGVAVGAQPATGAPATTLSPTALIIIGGAAAAALALGGGGGGGGGGPAPATSHSP
jgi:hypothetical protein